MTQTFTLPPPCHPGDKVAIISTSTNLAPLYPAVFELGLKRLREVFTLTPEPYPTTQAMGADFTPAPEARAADIMRAFADPSIKAVIATIGGDDQLRVLKHLDPDVLRDHPTRFFGFSDNTHLNLYLWNLGIVSFNGGSLMTQFAAPGQMDDMTVRYLKQALFGTHFGPLEPAPYTVTERIPWNTAEAITKRAPRRPNTGWVWHNPPREPVSGRVWGGCFAILEWQFQLRRYLPPFEALAGTVLAVETSEVMPEEFRVRLFFTILGELGLLERFSAVLVGRPCTNHLGVTPPEGEEAYTLAQRDAITKAISEYAPGLPVIFNIDFGHTDPQIPLPIGGVAAIDGTRRTIRIDYA